MLQFWFFCNFGGFCLSMVRLEWLVKKWPARMTRTIFATYAPNTVWRLKKKKFHQQYAKRTSYVSKLKFETVSGFSRNICVCPATINCCSLKEEFVRRFRINHQQRGICPYTRNAISVWPKMLSAWIDRQRIVFHTQMCVLWKKPNYMGMIRNNLVWYTFSCFTQAK